jgi:hypothetical protein
VLDVVHGYRERGLATPITGDVLMRAGVSESLVPRTLRSLQGLELIDELGMPTPALESLRLATSPDFQARLADWVRGVYVEVFSFTDPAKDDASRIADAFRSFTPIGQRGRMVTLFLGLCEAAGIVEKPAKPSRPATTVTTGTARIRVSARPAAITNNRPTGSAAKARPSENGHVPSVIRGLLDSLPREGEGWTRERRDALYKTFGALLDFCYPIVAAEEPDPDRYDPDRYANSQR